MENIEKRKSIKSFVEKHKTGLCVAGGSIGTAVLGYLGYRYIPNFKAKHIAEPAKKMVESVDVLKESEEMFKGVSLSKLDELAKEMYHGIGCAIDQWGFLVFKYKSNRGHQTFCPQMCVENGKLINLGGHFPNQWWSTADEFAKRANELFDFTE